MEDFEFRMSRREGSVYGGDPHRSAGPIQDPHFLSQHSAGPLWPAGPPVGPQPVAAHRTGFLGNSESRSVSPFRPAGPRRTGLIGQSEPCSAGPEERAGPGAGAHRAGPSEHSLRRECFRSLCCRIQGAYRENGCHCSTELSTDG